MNGLFLQGGGAKGAFQAGALYALHEKGIRFQFVTGTSIGAINGYYLYTGNLEGLKELYTEHIENKEHQENKGQTNPIKLNKVIENEYLINKLGKLKTIDSSVQEFLINYVYINGCVPEEKVVNLNEFPKGKAIEFVKYSSLLPYAVEGEQVIDNFESFIKSFDSSKVFEDFKVMVMKGMYNGYSLDGGILNNTFLKPFVEKNRDESIDKIYMLPLSNSFQVPEYIYKKYNKEQIIVIKRQKEFMPYHTLNFKEEFLKELFYEGYQAVKYSEVLSS